MTQLNGFRTDGREFNQMRKISIVPAASPYAEGSAEVSFGNTKVLVTASVERDVPKWMKPGSGGWITAEYGMLPRSTHTRMRREAASGKQEGRTLEIQRLVGRALRAAVDLSKLEGLTIRLDCDVIVADGGTRTAAISGGWVALALALRWCEQNGLITEKNLRLVHVAAISVGVVDGRDLIDLHYEEDSSAEFDLNVVCTNNGELIEVQGTGERAGVVPERFFGLISLAMNGCRDIIEIQKRAVGCC